MWTLIFASGFYSSLAVPPSSQPLSSPAAAPTKQEAVIVKEEKDVPIVNETIVLPEEELDESFVKNGG